MKIPTYMTRTASEREVRETAASFILSLRWVRIIPVALIIALSGVGACEPMGAFWAIPTETMLSKIVGSVMGFVNAIGNLGDYFAPLIVGYLNKRTGTFLVGFSYLGAITLAAAGLATLIRTTPDSQVTLEQNA
jgi:nitrate/nitrite transporter NarK